MRTAAYIDWIYRVGPNQAVAESFNRLDYVGIVFLITGKVKGRLHYGRLDFADAGRSYQVHTILLYTMVSTASQYGRLSTCWA